ncbi:MAG TPA: hypothetical protein VKX25_10245 [Bryobacteraceae bacterium]|jgi:hypothetical protein|nr:hypothetical protein [Bryobacteraceae bacterium]
MALESKIGEFISELRRLRDAFEALSLTIVEDRPAKGAAVLLDQMGDAILALMGLLDECLLHARAAEGAVGSQVDFHAARRALGRCQNQVHQIEAQFVSELASYERLKDLACLGKERRGEWRAWAGSTRDGVERCREPLQALSQALARCWEEMAEHAGSNAVSVHTISIGKKVVNRGVETSQERM